MLGIRSSNSLSFYDWDNLNLIRRIEINPKGVFWSENGELVSITTDDSYFILRYDADAVAKSLETKEGLTEDAGIEVCLNYLPTWTSEIRMKLMKFVLDCI